MSKYLTIEDIARAIDNAKPLTAEQKAKLEELGRKMKETTYEERRAMRLKADEERGYCD